MNLQEQYDKIYSYFKTTSEPFDKLDWDGSILKVLLNEKLVEEYSVADLKEFIRDF
ncbi:MAG: hypothetical protein HUU47_10065 [Bacteroidetes bacterium]|nr:hypothetical protein [Bacteroidota bacterium]